MNARAPGGSRLRRLLLARDSRRGVPAVFGAWFLATVAVVLARAGVWAGLSAGERAAPLVLAALFGAGWVGTRPRPGGTALGRRFAANPAAVASLALLLGLVCASVLAPLVAGADPAALSIPSQTRYAPPDASHPMGTDRFGRDVWARVVYGGRASFGVCALSVLLAAGFGTALGAVSGMAHARVDAALMRLVDAMLSFPRLLLLLAAVAFLPPSPALLALLIAGTSWMGIARIVRGEVRRLRAREFVDAAVASGMGRGRIVLRHILPNAAGPVIVAATLGAGTVILLESSLSFLGLGVQPPTPSWGSMVFEGRDALASAWWVSAFPALAITLAVVSLNLVGDGLRDALDARR
jgi:peptide/nickel transport system permease protein